MYTYLREYGASPLFFSWITSVVEGISAEQITRVSVHISPGSAVTIISHTIQDAVEFKDCFLCIGMNVGGTTGYITFI
jgi:hypothetical protein